MKISCYFCDYKNFGDQLNLLIFEKLLQSKIYWITYERAKIIGIGSIIDAIILREDQKINNDKIYCFSSGFSRENQINEILSDVNKIMLSRPVEFIAVRGEKTKKILIRNGLLSKNDNPILADAGILAPILLEKKIKKKYDVGIVAHAQEMDTPFFKEINKKIPNSIILDITKSPLKFLNDLASCRTIISSAMHPLIVADSLNIPNIWLKLPDSFSKTDRFKFDDYYSAYGIEKNPITINEIDSKIFNKIIENYDIPYDVVQRKIAQLKDAGENMKNQLSCTKRSYFYDMIFFATKFYPNKFFIYYPKRFLEKTIYFIRRKK